MKIKRIAYKGIKFDFFWVYDIYGDYIGGPYDEIDRMEIDSFGVTVCPHCIKKYGLYKEAERTPEEIEKEIAMYDGEDLTQYAENVCCVDGCNNGLGDDIFLDWMDVEIKEF